MSRCVKMAVRETFMVVLTLALIGMAVMPAQAGDKEDIVGRWDHPATEASFFRFYEDGTFKQVALLDTAEGKYRFLGKEVIEFDTPGLIYGRNKVEIKYRLTKDTLELKLLGEWVKYKRVK
jgi:hypothetical protein